MLFTYYVLKSRCFARGALEDQGLINTPQVTDTVYIYQFLHDKRKVNVWKVTSSYYWELSLDVVCVYYIVVTLTKYLLI